MFFVSKKLASSKTDVLFFRWYTTSGRSQSCGHPCKVREVAFSTLVQTIVCGECSFSLHLSSSFITSD